MNADIIQIVFAHCHAAIALDLIDAHEAVNPPTARTPLVARTPVAVQPTLPTLPVPAWDVYDSAPVTVRIPARPVLRATKVAA